MGVFALVALSTAQAETVTIPVTLSVPTEFEPVKAELTLTPNSIQLGLGILSYTSQGIQHNFTMPDRDFPTLYKIYQSERKSWELATLWSDHPIYFPVSFDKSIPIEAAQGTDGRIRFQISFEERKYTGGSHWVGYGNSVPLEGLRIREPVPLQRGQSLLFFPNGRGQQAVPVQWLGRDPWARNIVTVNEHRPNVYGTQRGMLGVPSRNALNVAAAGIPFPESMLKPWQCGTVFQIAAPEGFSPVLN